MAPRRPARESAPAQSVMGRSAAREGERPDRRTGARSDAREPELGHGEEAKGQEPDFVAEAAQAEVRVARSQSYATFSNRD